MKCVACGYEAEIEENFNSWGFKKLNIEISINGHDNNCKTTIDGKVETKLKELLYKIAYDYDFIIEEMEVMPDHVHILISLQSTIWYYAMCSKY